MWLSLLVLFASGVLTGVTTVLFGFGGGFITVPVVFGVVQASSGAEAMHVAVATSTAVMVVNSVTATVVQVRAGRVRTHYVWPLALFIAIGSVLGSLAASRVGDSLLHVLFLAYLAITILDSVVRGGFLGTGAAEPDRGLSRAVATAGGVGIGAVASFLGVGGSVLTVPLLRRKGLPMAEATSMANPLSAPVAILGTVVYAFATSANPRPGQVGYVDLVAAAVLLCGSLPTIALVKRAVGRIGDRTHAVAYLALLVTVLIAMILTGVS